MAAKKTPKPIGKIYKSKDGQYYFTISGAMGQVLVTSETYKTIAGAQKGITSLLKAMLRMQDNRLVEYMGGEEKSN